MRRSVRERQRNTRLCDYESLNDDDSQEPEPLPATRTARTRTKGGKKTNIRQQQAGIPLPSNAENADPNIPAALAVSRANSNQARDEPAAPPPPTTADSSFSIDDSDGEHSPINRRVSNQRNRIRPVAIFQSELHNSDSEDEENRPVNAMPQPPPPPPPQQQQPIRRSNRVPKRRVVWDEASEGEDVAASPPKRLRRTSESEEEYRPTRRQAVQAAPAIQRERKAKWPQRDATPGVSSIDIDESLWPYHNIGARDQLCRHCGAPLWRQELTRTKICCCNGDAVAALKGIFSVPLPEDLRSLFFDTTQKAEQFRQNIRHYNTVLSMASSGINLQQPRGGVSMLAIRGGIYHRIGPLEPAAGTNPVYSEVEKASHRPRAPGNLCCNRGGGLWTRCGKNYIRS
jgi:hypothetical protein